MQFSKWVNGVLGETRLRGVLAEALGSFSMTPLELAQWYGAVHSGGRLYSSHTVTKVLDRNGKVVWSPENRKRRLFQPEVSGVLKESLRSVAREGTGKSARLPNCSVSGKTGTNSRNRDSWFAGVAVRLLRCCGLEETIMVRLKGEEDV